MANVRIVLRMFVQHAKADHDQRRPRDQPEQTRQRTRHAAKAHPDRHRKIDHIAARQKLAQTQQVGEFRAGQPTPLLDQGAPRQRQCAAE